MCRLGNPPPLGAGQENQTSFVLLQSQRVTDNGQRYEVVIADELRSRERRQRIDEQLASAVELAHRDEVQAAVDFEAVTTIPVAALFYESAKRGKEGR